MGELAFQRALESLWRLLAEANGYLVEREPWKLIKTEGASERVARILWNGLEAVRIVATGLLPFMPRVAPQVLAAVGSPVPPTSFDGAAAALAGLGRHADLGAAARAGAALPAHRQGGLLRRGGAGGRDGRRDGAGVGARQPAAPARRLQGVRAR